VRCNSKSEGKGGEGQARGSEQIYQDALKRVGREAMEDMEGKAMGWLRVYYAMD